eukprot:m.413866 g.413866  ORF g.413866 m.413866 type:complete len:56 (-) comp29188_c0_seq1:429-596(-)
MPRAVRPIDTAYRRSRTPTNSKEAVSPEFKLPTTENFLLPTTSCGISFKMVFKSG